MMIVGKAVGTIVGAVVLRHPIGAVVGFIAGYFVDQWLEQRATRLDLPGEDPYRTLGVPSDSSDADIDLAYRRLIAQYHPDKVAGAAEEIRRLADQRAAAINQAYESIQKRRRGR